MLMPDECRSYKTNKVDKHCFDNMENSRPNHCQPDEFCPSVFRDFKRRHSVEEVGYLVSYVDVKAAAASTTSMATSNDLPSITAALQKIGRKVEFVRRRLRGCQSQQSALFCLQQLDALIERYAYAVDEIRSLQLDPRLDARLADCLPLIGRLLRNAGLRQQSVGKLTKLVRNLEPWRLVELASPSLICRRLTSPFMAPPPPPPQRDVGGAETTTTSQQIDDVRMNLEALRSHLGGLATDGYDSDATESSSCDSEREEEEDSEISVTDNKAVITFPKCVDSAYQQHSSDISAVEVKEEEELGEELPQMSLQWWWYRAVCAARWSWLQAQSAELELRARSMQQLLRHLRSKANQRQWLLPNLTAAADGDSCARTTPIATAAVAHNNSAAAAAHRRRFAHTAGMFRWNRKTARLSTCACACSPPLPGCVQCAGGRTNPHSKEIDPCAQGLGERASLLNAHLHQALSASSEIPISDRLQLILMEPKLFDQRAQQLSAGLAGYKRVRQPLVADCCPECSFPNKLPRISSSNDAHVDVRSSVTDPTADVISDEQKVHELRISLRSSLLPAANGGWRGAEELQLLPHSSRSGTATPMSPFASSQPSPKSWGGSALPTPGRRTLAAALSSASSSTYDIDNIVIDPSVAASQKIEKPTYKPLMTPGWRQPEQLLPAVFEEIEGEGELDDHHQEETDDEAYLERHFQLENEEKQRFQAYKQWAQRNADAALAANRAHFLASSAMLASVQMQQQLPSNAIALAAANYCSDSNDSEQQLLANAAANMMPPDGGGYQYPTRQFPLTERAFEALLADNNESA